jgi:hypothetical protein
MTSVMGYSSVKGNLPSKQPRFNVCLICDEAMGDTSVRAVPLPGQEAKDIPQQPTLTLECSHKFHGAPAVVRTMRRGGER